MRERCAVCEGDDVWKRVTLPDAWETYLADERGLDPADGYYLLPTCRDCSGDVDMQKTLEVAIGGMDDDTPALLDGLVLEALVDETGDSAD
jgi:hypothetical protein